MKSLRLSQLPPDLRRFLQRNTRAFLFGLRKDGSPTGHPMTGIYAQTRLFVNTYRKSAKARNIVRDSRTCYLVVNGYDAEKVYGVAVKGEARILEEGRIPGRRDEPGNTTTERIGPDVRQLLRSGKRVFVEVIPSEAGFIHNVRRVSENA